MFVPQGFDLKCVWNLRDVSASYWNSKALLFSVWPNSPFGQRVFDFWWLGGWLFFAVDCPGAIFIILQSPFLLAVLAPVLEGEMIKGNRNHVTSSSRLPTPETWRVRSDAESAGYIGEVDVSVLFTRLPSWPLTTLQVIIGCIWSLSFPHSIIVFKMYLYSGVCCREAVSVDIHILVQVTKTYCLLLGEISFKMESQYLTLVKIFMYIKDEFLNFMNILSQKYRL